MTNRVILESAGGVLLDTSFFTRLLKADHPDRPMALHYFETFIENDWTMYLSPIVIGEWTVYGTLAELPTDNLEMLNLTPWHAERAGLFTKHGLAIAAGQARERGERYIVKNDTLLFAQADQHQKITHFLTADGECEKVYNRIIGAGVKPSFTFARLLNPLEAAFPVKRRAPDLFTHPARQEEKVLPGFQEEVVGVNGTDES